MSSSSQSQKPDVTLSLSLPQSPTTNDGLRPQERSVKLIQLLLTCANHVSSGNLHHADTCLRQISELASVTGDSMQRLAARFAAALAARLVKRWPGLYKALNNGGLGPVSYDVDHGRSIFIRLFPCLGFAYAVINRTLVQALLGERVIHVIDLGSSDQELWVPFIRGIASGPDVPPHLKITCVSTNKEAHERLEVGLIKEAKSLNVPFEFNCVNTRQRVDFGHLKTLRLVDRRARITTLEEMFGKEIENVVAGEGLEREKRHERYAKWAVRFGRAGFRPVRLWYETMEEAQQVIEAFGPGGFKVINQKGCLMICWHDRPIYAVSAWNCFTC
ncbi:hypothetical protein DH2020_009239 [Rehmannia glutinosa]|uniref:Scarecrow-like protein 3 n=1 Tax=Rehmannia glutinosa TaxID=99300 RepID=A0ABR0X705_REHGL